MNQNNNNNTLKCQLESAAAKLGIPKKIFFDAAIKKGSISHEQCGYKLDLNGMLYFPDDPNLYSSLKMKIKKVNGVPMVENEYSILGSAPEPVLSLPLLVPVPETAFAVTPLVVVPLPTEQSGSDEIVSSPSPLPKVSLQEEILTVETIPPATSAVVDEVLRSSPVTTCPAVVSYGISVPGFLATCVGSPPVKVVDPYDYLEGGVLDDLFDPEAKRGECYLHLYSASDRVKVKGYMQGARVMDARQFRHLHQQGVVPEDKNVFVGYTVPCVGHIKHEFDPMFTAINARKVYGGAETYSDFWFNVMFFMPRIFCWVFILVLGSIPISYVFGACGEPSYVDPFHMTTAQIVSELSLYIVPGAGFSTTVACSGTFVVSFANTRLHALMMEFQSRAHGTPLAQYFG